MDGKAVNVHTMPDDLLLVSLLIHKGQYPLYDVSVRFANGDTLDLNASTYSIGNMAVELSIQRPIRLSHHGKNISYKALRCSEWVAVCSRPQPFSVRSARKRSPAYQRGQPVQHGGRLSLARQAFVNAGLRPPPSAAVGVDKRSPRQPCSPPSVRRKGMAERPAPTAKALLPTPNSEEATF
jgi:hypothetical protein